MLRLTSTKIPGGIWSKYLVKIVISQVLRLTGTKIPGGIWYKYLVKIVISQGLRLEISQAGLIRPIFITQGLRLKTSQAGLIGKRSKELINLYLTRVEIKNKPGGLNSIKGLKIDQ